MSPVVRGAERGISGRSPPSLSLPLSGLPGGIVKKRFPFLLLLLLFAPKSEEEEEEEAKRGGR